ncbi:CBS domain-containing protein [Actinophytocola sp.]|uniref:CBS domain-containing protein n=1 Tax=Actinophytocola sp. TaxID=1872138 RepID=UPI002D800658|nr:CBS domain-containing protein [Actinophytocola sp.]HET9142376.1 CBS domain-containing protein [Actinophytocola sp.]
MKHRKVADVMTTEVTTVEEGTPYKDIVALLHEREVSGVPVLDADGRLAGMVTEGDLLPRQGGRQQAPARRRIRVPRQRVRQVQATTAAGLMSTPVHTVGPEATVAEAARLIEAYGVRRLPVVDGNDALVGIVSRRDLLEVFLRPDSDIAAEIAHDVFERGMGVPVGPDEVTIEVRHGVVVLRGELERRSLVPVAERLTARVDGVVDVRSQLSYAFDDSAVRVPGSMAVDITHEPVPVYYRPPR